MKNATQIEHAPMQPGDERVIRVEGQAVGFVRRTLGGFYRAYSYQCGMGNGPFETPKMAESWIRTRTPVPGYWRGVGTVSR